MLRTGTKFERTTNAREQLYIAGLVHPRLSAAFHSIFLTLRITDETEAPCALLRSEGLCTIFWCFISRVTQNSFLSHASLFRCCYALGADCYTGMLLSMRTLHAPKVVLQDWPTAWFFFGWSKDDCYGIEHSRMRGMKWLNAVLICFASTLKMCNEHKRSCMGCRQLQESSDMQLPFHLHPERGG